MPWAAVAGPVILWGGNLQLLLVTLMRVSNTLWGGNVQGFKWKTELDNDAILV